MADRKADPAWGVPWPKSARRRHRRCGFCEAEGQLLSRKACSRRAGRFRAHRRFFHALCAPCPKGSSPLHAQGLSRRNGDFQPLYQSSYSRVVVEDGPLVVARFIRDSQSAHASTFHPKSSTHLQVQLRRADQIVTSTISGEPKGLAHRVPQTARLASGLAGWTVLRPLHTFSAAAMLQEQAGRAGCAGLTTRNSARLAASSRSHGAPLQERLLRTCQKN